jgi:hypothetical protein
VHPYSGDTITFAANTTPITLNIDIQAG